MKTPWNQPLPALFPDPLKAFTEKWEATARSIPPDAEVLTDEQKMAICVVMRVPIKMASDGESKLTLTTEGKVGFAKVDGKWTVFRAADV